MSDTEDKIPETGKKTGKGLFSRLLPGKGKKAAPAEPAGDAVPEPKERKASGFLSKLRAGKAAKAAKTEAGEPVPPGAKKSSGIAGLFSGMSGKKKQDADVTEGALLAIPKGLHVEIDVINDGVIQIGRTKAAMDLSWRGYNAGRKIKEQAETASASGKSEDYNLYVDTRSTGMIAFGSGLAGHKRGMRALITMIDGRYVGRNWLAAFKLGEANPVFWIGSMRGGQVYEDRIAKDPDTAREIILGLIDAPDWNKIIAPEEFGIRGTEAAQLSDIVDVKIGLPLKPVRPIRANLPRIIAGIVVLVAVGFGYARWHGLKVAEIERLAEIRRMERESVRVKPEDYPWFESATIGDFISTCKSEIESSVILATGWRTGPVACTITRGNGSITTTWQRANGRIAWLIGALPEGFPEPRMDNGGNNANFNRSFEGPKRQDALSDQNWSGARIQNTLLSRFQNLDLPIVMNEVVQRQAQNRRNAQKAVFNHHIVQIRTKLPIGEFGPLLGDIPGVAPDSLIYTPAENSWSLIMRVYHPPILPAEN